MKYAPGSFSKNFAWHGTGLRKLHTAIRAGFGTTLRPVPREKWRSNSNIGDPALELIPINFFLHNAHGQISVDELVFQAIKHPHSIQFDRLALFAFHLNRVGNPPAHIERPAMWANEFVREMLWKNDAWRTNALDDSTLDAFIADRLKAQQDVRIKCRNNYRHFFELCDYLPARLPIINTGSESWMAPALFLAWDRLTIDKGRQSKSELLNHLKAEELHKLIGTSEGDLAGQAPSLADLYQAIGALGRVESPTPPVVAVELSKAANIEWVDQEETDAAVERRRLEVQAQVRDRKKAAVLKAHYQNTCMICGIALQVGPNRHYSEAAHIKPLGKPHNGADKLGNMLVMCPNHHLQFDRGVLRLIKDDAKYVIRSEVKDDPLNGQPIVVKHPIDDDCLRWHADWFAAKRK
jgi:hypothetical protein